MCLIYYHYCLNYDKCPNQDKYWSFWRNGSKILIDNAKVCKKHWELNGNGLTSGYPSPAFHFPQAHCPDKTFHLARVIYHCKTCGSPAGQPQVTNVIIGDPANPIDDPGKPRSDTAASHIVEEMRPYAEFLESLYGPAQQQIERQKWERGRSDSRSGEEGRRTERSRSRTVGPGEGETPRSSRSLSRSTKGGGDDDSPTLGKSAS